MRLPTKQHRLERHISALICVAVVWLGACGCQGPQFDRLDGSQSLFASGQEPVVENGPPPSRPPRRDVPTRDASTPPAGDAGAQSIATAKATITEQLNRGHRETAAKHYEQAEVCYRSVLELEPDNAIANHRLAVLADRRGDFATSEKCYLIALKREPNDPDLLSDLGYSYLLQGRPTESERCLFAALRANPLHQKARDNLGLLYAKQGDRERAFEMVKRSVGEAEARSRLAQFFPPAQPAVRAEDTFTASFSPASSPAAAADVKPAAATPLPDVAQSSPSPPRAVEPAGTADQSPLERQIALMMEQERQRAIQERLKREAGASQIAPPAQVPAPRETLTTSIDTEPVPHPAARPLPASDIVNVDRSAEPVASPPVVPSGRVPDDRINDAFAAIDREGTENAGAPSPPADNAPSQDNAPAQSVAPTPWRNPTAEATTHFAPQQSTNPLASMPLWPAQSPTRPAAAFQGTTSAATMSPSAEVAPPAPVARPKIVVAPTPPPPSVPNDWGPVGTMLPSDQSAAARNDFLSAPADTLSPARTPQAPWDDSLRIEPNRELADRPAAPSRVLTTRPASAEQKDGWDRDAEATPPQWNNQWPGANVNTDGQTPSGPDSRVDPVLDSQLSPSQANPSPRIVPTGILPSTHETSTHETSTRGTSTLVPPTGSPQRPMQRRKPDELDEFEAQIQKNNSKSSSGRSSSNAGAAMKPAAPGDPSTAGRDPWPLRIEPHRDPPPLFAPDDGSARDKKLPIDKENSFDAGNNWSDVPPWPSKPASGSSSANQNGGPAIRPGSF
jgi:Tfp pilus assembly protein PilF